MADEKNLLFTLTLEGSQEELERLAKINANIKELRKEIKEVEKVDGKAAELKKQQLKIEQENYRKLSKELQNQNKAQQDNIKTLQSMRASLANMNAELERVEFGSARFKELTEQSRKLRNEIKGAEEDTGRFQMNVGNYAGGVISAFQKMGFSVQDLTKHMGGAGSAANFMQQSIVNSFTSITNVFNKTSASVGGLSKGINTATTSTNLFKKALIATGIGAIAVAVGTLAAAFFSTVQGVEWLSRKLEPLKAIFETIWGQIQELVQGTGALMKMLEGLVKFDWGKVKEGAAEFRGEMERAYEGGQRVAEINIRLKKLAIERAENEARLNREMAEQRAILSDVNKSQEERKAAGQKYLELQWQLVDMDKRQAELEYERMKIESSRNDTSLEQQAELAAAREKINEIEANRLNETRRITNQINSIIKAQADEMAKLEAAYQKTLQTLRDEYTKTLEEIEPQMVELNLEIDAVLDATQEKQLAHLNRTADNIKFERELYAETYAGRLEAMQAMYEAGEIGEQRLAALQKALAREVLDTKLSAASSFLTSIASMTSEESALHKAAAVAAATIDTYKAAAAAMAAPPGPPFSYVYMAAAIATGLGNVRKILATKEPPKDVRVRKYAGGVIGVQGRGTTTSDSILARISKDESVMTAKATREFAPILADMERAVGNVPNVQFKNGRFAKGYIAERFQPSNSMRIDYKGLIQETIRSLGKIPVVVSERDITNMQDRVRKIKVTGDL